MIERILPKSYSERKLDDLLDIEEEELGNPKEILFNEEFNIQNIKSNLERITGYSNREIPPQNYRKSIGRINRGIYGFQRILEKIDFGKIESITVDYYQLIDRSNFLIRTNYQLVKHGGFSGKLEDGIITFYLVRKDEITPDQVQVYHLDSFTLNEVKRHIKYAQKYLARLYDPDIRESFGPTFGINPKYLAKNYKNGVIELNADLDFYANYLDWTSKLLRTIPLKVKKINIGKKIK